MSKDDGSQEVVNTKNILIATGSEVSPFPGIEVGYCMRVFFVFFIALYRDDESEKKFNHK